MKKIRESNKIKYRLIMLLAATLFLCIPVTVHAEEGLMIHGKSQVIAGQETPLTLILQGKKVSPEEAEWESSDRHTAFVEKDGILTAGDIKKEKTVTITATVTVDDEEYEAEKQIRVLPQVKDVKIYRNEDNADGKLMNFDSSVLPDGEGKAAKVMVLEAKCEPEQALQKVVWKSSDLSVASIDSEGTIHFKGTGKTVITATAADGSGVSEKVTISVSDPIEKIKVKPEDMPDTEFVEHGETAEYLVLSDGQTLQLYTDISPKGASSAAVRWSSSNESVATVDEDGLVTADFTDSLQEVTITASAEDDSSVSDEFTFRVAPRFDLMYGDKRINDETIHLYLEDGYRDVQLRLVQEFAEYGKLTWSSEDSEIADVDQNGKIHAYKAGDVIIRALLLCGDDRYIIAKTKVVVLDEDASHYDRTEAMAEVDRYVVEKERNLGEKLTITCIGDSITYGTKLLNDVDYKEIVYPNYLGEYLEAENVYTMGVGGMPISRVVKDLNENDWGYYDWNPCMLDLFFDDNVNPTDPDKNNPNEEFYSDQNIERLEQSDVIVVMGGVNDSFQTFDSVKDARTVLGMSEDETPTAEQVQEVFLEKRFGSVGSCKEKTFCGDVDKLMKKLKKCAPDAQIIFFTPFQNTVSNGNDMYPLEEYVDAIKKLGKENDITVVDTYGQDFMNTAGAQVRKKYMPDGVHGNAAGNRLIANHVAAWILRGRE